MKKEVVALDSCYGKKRFFLAVQKLIAENRRIIYEEIQQILQIGLGSVHDILHKHPHVRRIVSRWAKRGRVADHLTDAQKHARVEWCLDLIAKFDAGLSRRVYIITKS